MVKIKKKKDYILKKIATFYSNNKAEEYGVASKIRGGELNGK